MRDAGSVTLLIGQLQAKDGAAIDPLWERYFHRLVGLARKKLGNQPRAAADEEDVALSAIDSFFRRAEQGKFPRLADRHDLWALLVRITANKAFDLITHETQQKRDWRRVGQGAADPEGEAAVARLAGQEPDPAFAAEMADQCRHLLDALDDDELRTIAVRKLEGHTNQEIATQIDCALATVERRLALIRELWGDGASR